MAAADFTGSATFSASSTRTADFASARFSIRGSFDAPVALRSRPEGSIWRVVVVDVNGTPIAELGTAKVGPITWELNKWEEVSIAFSLDDPAAYFAVAERFHEVQVWRDDALLVWGPMVRPATAETKLSAVDVKGPLWYFSRRNIGRAGRVNYVENGSFEEGSAGWDIGYFSPVEPIENRTGANFEWAISTTRAKTGRRSLYLAQTDEDTPELGVAAVQTFVAEVPEENREGDSWTVVAYVFIPDEEWIAPNPLGLGLRLARFSSTQTITLTPAGGSPGVYPAPIETVEVALDEDTPRGVWHRMEGNFVAPITGEPEFIQVAVLAPVGGAYWDQIRLVQDEALRFYEAEQTYIAGQIVEHLQEPEYGKTDLNIRTNTPPSGVRRDRVYRFSEHPPGFDALSEFPALADGFDHSVQITPTERIYTTHYPRKGRRVPRAALELGKNIASWAWAFDGETAANSVVVLGQGDGPDREEGEASDPSLFADGVVLETMYVAPPTSPIDALDDLAGEELTIAADPQILTVTTHRHPTGLLGVVWPGDIVPVKIIEAALEIVQDFRIVKMVLDPDADSITFTLHVRLDP